MLKTLRKLFKLPGPKELGMSERDALGCRELTPFQDGPTWDDWREIVQEKHPIKYFLSEKLVPAVVWPVQRVVKDSWYWVKCHTLPSYRFHKLDFRGVDPLHKYTHGYIDPCTVMQWGAWAALRIYVEKELIHEHYANPEAYTEEDRNSDWFNEQKRQRYDEPMALYKYWMEDRAAEKKEEDRLFALTKINRKNALDKLSKADYDKASEEWLAYHRACEAREQEMFMKLCALREYLWT